jgi:hypothetical protein
MATAHYCTYFDHRYLSLGLALHASLRRHCSPFRLWALCLSDECYAVVKSLAFPDLIPLRLSDLEAHDPELLAVKGGRTTLEYYFACTPALIAWLLATEPEIDVLTYLDSDLYFFSSPQLLFDAFADYSIFIVPHNFSQRNMHFLEKSGIYNVGWVSFRRDEYGLACLRWWRMRCLETTAAANGQCGDQKYLDHFPEKFSRVYIERHPGVNLAPWNLDNYQLSVSQSGTPLVDGIPVIFFHFSQLRRITSFLWRVPYRNFGVSVNRLTRTALFRPYLADVVAAEKLAGYDLSTPTQVPGRASLRHGRLLQMLHELVGMLTYGGGIWIIGGRAV